MSGIFLIIIETTKKSKVLKYVTIQRQYTLMYRNCLLQIRAADYGSWEHPNVNNDSFLGNYNRGTCLAYEYINTKRQ